VKARIEQKLAGAVMAELQFPRLCNGCWKAALGSRNNLCNPARNNKATELALSHCTGFNQF